MNKHLTEQSSSISNELRSSLNGYKSMVIWFTGLSGSGKSTLAQALERRLFDDKKIRSYVLDGDNLRLGLNQDLGFSAEDRKENMRRTGEMAKILVDAGVVAITSLISPFREERAAVRRLFAEDAFVEVFVSCSLEACETRDPKGLYRKARNNEIADFTGISSPYEEPTAADLVVPTDRLNVDESVSLILSYLVERGLLSE
ncbi:adenylyl-sulfate kinase [Paenibacillus marchantiophytorum]|uniref:Adenylyl-sulfate kinase n=1 Tax=Paenibacillus marchantiophytorum TaxID=1619310 RepID=A0ABQ2BUV1_9BACL|nr:adenylyl-sulfate kinase [Paenibacillus marchantiophytorum]GGI46278.1 adenylyl-sulfate kinase [Paenibacillus marchantiophytorum]